MKIAAKQNKLRPENLFGRFAAARVRPALFWVLAALVVAVRMVVALAQRVYLAPETSGLDDMLMVRGAMSITDGNWLGDYQYLTLAKNMGFSLWLALLHGLGLPLLATNAVLWLAASAMGAFALRPVLRGNVAQLAVFAFLAFFPFSFAPFTMRAYRDGIFQAFCLLLFAGMLGLGLRLWRQGSLRVADGKKDVAKGLWGGRVLCAVAAGLGLAGAWLLREDGLVLLVFALCAALALGLYVLLAAGVRQRVLQLLCLLLPFVLLVGGVLGFAGANRARYGVFVVSDLNEGSFPRAYGAMVGVSRAESGYRRFVPVTRVALANLMEQVPSLGLLEEALADESLYRGLMSRDGSDEFGASFYYALRLAAQVAGQTPDAVAAESYWQRVADEILQAVAEGRLQSVGSGASLLPGWSGELLGPVLAETGRGFLAVMTLPDCNPRPMESEGDPAWIAEVADYLHERVQTGYVEHTSQPYYSLWRQAAFLLCDVLMWVYRLLLWPMLLVGLWCFGQLARTGLCVLRGKTAIAVQASADAQADKVNDSRKGKASLPLGGRLSPALLWAILLLGLLCSFVLRLVVAAYMEVASFDIGTYVMYLAGGVPALLLFCLAAPGMAAETSGRAPFGVTKGDAVVQAVDDTTADTVDSGILQRVRKLGARDIPREWMLVLGVLLLGVWLLLASAQQVYLFPAAAPFDDTLMTNLAQSISEGRWLGDYNYLTLSKHSFFALWLAGLHELGIPFLLGGRLLWAIAAACAAWAFAPVLRRYKYCLLLYVGLLFLPSALANPMPNGYITRVYRDNIFPALCMLCVAGMVGFALRRRVKLRFSLGWLVVAGLTLGACYLTREDGWWLLPFVLAAAVATACFVLWEKTVPAPKAGEEGEREPQEKGRTLGGRGKLLRCLALLLPFVLLAGADLAWRGMNQAVYGRFIISDFSSGEFADAYGAMTRIRHESWDPKVAVPADVREKLYATVPAMAELQPRLEDPAFRRRHNAVEDYSSGSFYWALREAAAAMGYYDTPQKSAAYFRQMADEINALCDSGALPAGARRSSVNPPIRTEYIVPVLRGTLENLVFCATMQQCDPRPMQSAWIASYEEEVAPLEAYLHEKAMTGPVDENRMPVYSAFQRVCFALLDAVCYLYGILLPLGLLLALVWQVRVGVSMLRGRHRRQATSGAAMAGVAVGDGVLWLVQLGIIGCILLRAAMIAFVDISSFKIGIYIMYLASIHPLLLVFALVGCVQWFGGSGKGDRERCGS